MGHLRLHRAAERMRGFLHSKATEMRAAMTGSELALSNALDDEWLRQEPLCSAYIADFLHRPCRLVVEVDGGYHNDPAQAYRDKCRDATMAAFGLEVMRFTNAQVDSDLPGTLAAIEAKLRHIRATRYTPKELPTRAPKPMADKMPRRTSEVRKPLKLSPHRTTAQDRGE